MEGHTMNNAADNPAQALDIGCSANKKSGFLGVDYVAGPDVDYVLDITKDRLSFDDSSISQVFSAHCMATRRALTMLDLCLGL
jgi:predicted SAM-dependent methyltransferase